MRYTHTNRYGERSLDIISNSSLHPNIRTIQTLTKLVCPPYRNNPYSTPHKSRQNQRSTINDQRSTINDQRSTINDQRSTTNDQQHIKTSKSIVSHHVHTTWAERTSERQGRTVQASTQRTTTTRSTTTITNIVGLEVITTSGSRRDGSGQRTVPNASQRVTMWRTVQL